MGRVSSYLTFSPLLRSSGISLLHLSWGFPRRALPVIPALWSPDFPHPRPFGLRPRLSDLVAALLYSMNVRMSKIFLKCPMAHGILNL